MRILYFYPENPLHKTKGNNARALALLEYFKNRNIEVDFVGVETDIFGANEIKALKEEKLISDGYFLPIFIRKKNKLKYFFYYSLPNKIKGKIGLFDNIRSGHLNAFNKVLKANNYDIILISYLYWSKLVVNNPNVKKAKLMIDTHDFLTSQFQKKKNFRLGPFFEKEIEILSHYDKILVISAEEKYLFSQFIDKEIALVTHSLPQKSALKTESKYDIIYVASENEHNVKSAKWFFNLVYPLLPKSLKIAVVGKIGKFIGEHNNVEKISFIENLDDAYRESKIAICPMLSGTGIKIKVIEALSFGIPVVCNERGVDGLVNKTNNGCLVSNDSNEFAAYINELLTDSNFYHKIHSEAVSYFSNHHSTDATYSVLDDVFKL
ncbi:glycosyltransferase [Flavobacterium phragmitis]|uniref:Glycosyltransferase involved in cell wall bisynthesis n=1 Tax=Flavobacterium phragmitis TaxID=739143 RepID=A0A1I1JU47_9FLAO|nr:glycosyltransferase [Flavobacterium phragmitis]SFC52177.1 Glycosyltransferase involved in cell wall bisynthesis [Flavobacterium phragmitis]